MLIKLWELFINSNQWLSSISVTDWRRSRSFCILYMYSRRKRNRRRNDSFIVVFWSTFFVVWEENWKKNDETYLHNSSQQNLRNLLLLQRHECRKINSPKLSLNTMQVWTGLEKCVTPFTFCYFLCSAYDEFDWELNRCHFRLAVVLQTNGRK